MQTTQLDAVATLHSPLGSHVRPVMHGPRGNIVRSIIPPGMVGKAARFRTIDEYWHILTGEAEIWRQSPSGEESLTRLTPGVTVDIPLGTRFQYRNRGQVDLEFVCIAMPPWPGDEEAVIESGPWQPTV